MFKFPCLVNFVFPESFCSILLSLSHVSEEASWFRRESFEISFFFYSTVIEDEDLIAFFNSAQSMGNNDGGSSSHGFVKSGGYFCLAVFIKCRRSLIKKEHLWFSDDGSSDSDSLLLTSGEFTSFKSALGSFESITKCNV